jgi:hypothetical protein
MRWIIIWHWITGVILEPMELLLCVYLWSPFANLSGRVNYVNYGRFDGYDENGQKRQPVLRDEIALSLGYSYNVPYTNLHIGANAKLISSTLESYNSLEDSRYRRYLYRWKKWCKLGLVIGILEHSLQLILVNEKLP